MLAPMAKTQRDSNARLGTTLSYTFMMKSGETRANKFTSTEATKASR